MTAPALSVYRADVAQAPAVNVGEPWQEPDGLSPRHLVLLAFLTLWAHGQLPEGGSTFGGRS